MKNLYPKERSKKNIKDRGITIKVKQTRNKRSERGTTRNQETCRNSVDKEQIIHDRSKRVPVKHK